MYRLKVDVRVEAAKALVDSFSVFGASSWEISRFCRAQYQNRWRTGRWSLGTFFTSAQISCLFKGKRFFAGDATVNSGYSIRQTIHALKEAGAEVIVAAALCTRGDIDAAVAIGVSDFRYLVECKILPREPSSWQLCRAGAPVNIRYTHGLEFVQCLYK